MTTAHLDSLLPGRYAISPMHWAAALIAGTIQDLNTRSRRGSRQHRGGQQIGVNVMGAVGELVVQSVARAKGVLTEDLAILETQWGGNGRGADLPHSQLDVKTIDSCPGKAYWAINANAANRLHAEGLRGYVAVALGQWGDSCIISKVASTDDVIHKRDGWACFGLGRYAQASFNRRRDSLASLGIDPGVWPTLQSGVATAALACLDQAADVLLYRFASLDPLSVEAAVCRIRSHVQGDEWSEAWSLDLRGDNPA